jgi:adhesin transport system outer membrane protein
VPAVPAVQPTVVAGAQAPEVRQPGIRVRDWLREAVNSHPTIRSALQREGAALAEVEAARWQFFPTPSVGYEVAARDPGAQASRGTGFVRLQQPLYTGGRLTRQLDRATAGARASASAVDEERRAIALRLVQAVGDARSAALKRQAYRESAASHVEFLSLVQRRVNEGLSARGDIVLARTRLASVRADLESSEVQLDQALSRLEQLLGRPLEAVEYAALRADDVDDAGSDWAMPSVEDLVAAGLQASPVVRRGLAQLEAARAEVGVTQASRVPEVFLRAEHTRGGVGSGQSQVYLGLRSNFGAGLSDGSAISASGQRVQAQQAEVDARRREVVEQVRAEHLAAMAGERRLGVLADSANYSATVVQAWRRQFLAGRKTWQDLMNAAREKAQADVALGEATAARWVSIHRLRLLTEDLETFLSPETQRTTTISGSR